jgi:hypothetical protein
MLDYTRKVGESAAIKKILDFVNSQQSVIDTIKKKAESLDAYKIG